jgi:hypothetical protein
VNIAQIWPGITPLNVWDLPYDAWLLGLAAIEQLKRDLEK